MGKRYQENILYSLESRILKLKEKNIYPHLSVIMVGNNKDSNHI